MFRVCKPLRFRPAVCRVRRVLLAWFKSILRLAILSALGAPGAMARAESTVRIRIPVQISPVRGFSFRANSSQQFGLTVNGVFKPIHSVEPGLAPRRLALILDTPDKTTAELAKITRELSTLFAYSNTNARVTLFTHEKHRAGLKKESLGFPASHLKWSDASIRPGEFKAHEDLLEFLGRGTLPAETNSLDLVPVREVLVLSDGGIGQAFAADSSELVSILRSRNIPLNFIQSGHPPIQKIADLVSAATFTGGNLYTELGSFSQTVYRMREDYHMRAALTYVEEEAQAAGLKKLEIKLADLDSNGRPVEGEESRNLGSYGLRFPHTICLSLLCWEESEPLNVWTNQMFVGLSLFAQTQILLSRQERDWAESWDHLENGLSQCRLGRMSSSRSDLVEVDVHQRMFIKQVVIQPGLGKAQGQSSETSYSVVLFRPKASDLVFECLGEGPPNPQLLEKALATLGSILNPQRLNVDSEPVLSDDGNRRAKLHVIKMDH